MQILYFLKKVWAGIPEVYVQIPPPSNVKFSNLFVLGYCDPIYDGILYVYLLSFHLFNNIIFKILIILFAFIGGKFDQASIAKKSKKRAKFQGAGHAIACRHHDGLAVTVL